MNAAEQAKSLEITSKIAAVINLFKQQFPDAKPDLTPWHRDAETQSRIDPDSIDIGFHLPGWSPRYQSRSILVQIRFHPDHASQAPKLIGIETVGINFQGQAWRLSTVDTWQVVGDYLPAADVGDRLKQFTRQTFELFQITGPAASR